MQNLIIHEYRIGVEENLYTCEISLNEINSMGLEIPEKYEDNPLRLIFGANIDIDNYKYEEKMFVECKIESEEWKNLSEAVKKYKEKKGEKNDSTWLLCTKEVKGLEVKKIIEKLVAKDQKFEIIYERFVDLIDGIEEQLDSDKDFKKNKDSF